MAWYEYRTATEAAYINVKQIELMREIMDKAAISKEEMIIGGVSMASMWTTEEESGQRVKIKKVLNGYIVEIGCQTVVFQDLQNMMAEVARYLANPDAVKKEYLDKYGQK